MQVCSAREMAELDAFVTSHYAIPADLLMESAGSAVVAAIGANFGFKNASKTAVICGTGNNGADGLVVARRLLALHPTCTVDVFISSKYREFKSLEGRANLERLQKFSNANIFWTLPHQIASYDLIVDALKGAGDSQLVDPENAIMALFRAGTRIVAVDVPSVRGIQYALIVCFGRLKWEVLEVGICEKLILSTISFPGNLANSNSQLIDVPILPRRDPAGHKGSFGKCRFHCGADGYFGAPYFACASFLKAGGGYACLVASGQVASTVAGLCPEIVFLNNSWEEDVVVMGCGSGPQFRPPAISASAHAIVVDGDALHLSIVKEILLGRDESSQWVVLTPHYGELLRLFPSLRECEGMEQRARFVQNELQQLGPNIVFVLKGPRTMVVSRDQIRVNLTGNSGMATPGSGDCLAGVLAAMLCHNRVDKFQAVCDGVFVHGLAGDIAKRKLGEDGMVASDILKSVGEAMLEIRTNYEQIRVDVLPEIIA